MTNFPTILALETATTACSVALSYQGQVYQQHSEIPRVHNKVLLGLIQAIVSEADIRFSDLDLIAVGHGPGSFVGARIAVSVAQGMAFALNTPVVPISTLQTIAQSAYQRYQLARVWVAVDAHANQVYQQQFQYDAMSQMMLPGTEITAVAPEQLITGAPDGTINAIGDAWTVYAEKIAQPAKIKLYPEWLPRAVDMLPIARDLDSRGASISAEHLQPVYVRGTSPWKKRQPN